MAEAIQLRGKLVNDRAREGSKFVGLEVAKQRKRNEDLLWSLFSVLRALGRHVEIPDSTVSCLCPTVQIIFMCHSKKFQQYSFMPPFV